MEQIGDVQTAYLCLHNPHPNTCGLKTVFAVPEALHTLQWIFPGLRQIPLMSPAYPSVAIFSDVLVCSCGRKRVYAQIALWTYLAIRSSVGTGTYAAGKVNSMASSKSAPSFLKS